VLAALARQAIWSGITPKFGLFLLKIPYRFRGLKI
jgi:hypothetical protein